MANTSNKLPKYAHFEVTNPAFNNPRKFKSFKHALSNNIDGYSIHCFDSRGRLVAMYDDKEDEFHVLEYANGVEANIYIKNTIS